MKQWLMKLFGVVSRELHEETKAKMNFFQSIVKQKEESVKEPVKYAVLYTKTERVYFRNPIQLPSITMSDAMLPRNGQLMTIYDAETMLPSYFCLVEDFVSIDICPAQIAYWDKKIAKKEKAAAKNEAKSN